MIDSNTLQSLLQSSEGVQNLTQLDVPPRSEFYASFECKVLIENKLAQIRIEFPKGFPYDVPVISLIPYDFFGFIPHIDSKGAICYTRKEDLFVNFQNPQGVVTYCLGLALETVRKGITGENKEDFPNEFEQYWGARKNIRELECDLDFTRGVKLIHIERHGNKLLAMEADRASRASRFLGKIPPTNQNGLYIHLPGPITPPKYDQVLSHTFVQDWLFKDVTPSLIEEIQQYIRRPKRNEYVVLSTNQPDGNLACFALELRSPAHADKHPLFDSRSCKSIFPLSVKRVDASFLVARGNVVNSLFGKQGVIIGCGSVGGFISEDLIRMGVSSLTLIDHDILSSENIHRHCIGWRGIGLPKVEVLKVHFSNAFPNVQINAFSATAFDAIQNQKADFSLVDFVVVATGNPAANCFLTQYFRDKHPGLPVLFSWLDPYGLGGHCLITNLKNSRGCYFFLYGDDVHFGCNRASFAHMNQPKHFSKFISGCNSAFVPYGCLDARQVANLTIRNLEKVLAGKETINAIVSWKGDPEAFEQAGFQVSNRYKQSEMELMDLQHNFADENCPICGNNF